ncbi:Reverse transcriptase [Theobroma cacao]|nr:Reverse transcriptase [Theobroma cacao]
MEDMREQEKVFDFLMGLDDTFSTVRSQILSVDPLPSLGKAYSIAAQEEKQRQVAANRVPTVEGAAFLAGQVTGDQVMTSRHAVANNKRSQNRRLEEKTEPDLPSRRPIGVGRVRDGLYYLEPIREGKALMANTSVVTRKRARQIPRKLADYDFALPPSLTSSSSTYTPTPKANSTDAMAKEISALEENKTWVLSYTQIEGVDFHETFAPVAKLVNVKFLLAVASVQNWELHQLDVNNAFLHGDLNEEVYMKIPQGFIRKGEQRVWNDSDRIVKLKRYLDKKFRIKDLEKLKYFFGIEVARSPSGIVLSQHKYVLDILSECGLMGNKPSSFPIDQQHKLASDTRPLCSNPELYRRLVGRLLYLTITRPDISYVVHLLSQFMHNPRQPHLNAVFRVLRYLKNASGQGLLLASNNSLSLRAYCDAD